MTMPNALRTWWTTVLHHCPPRGTGYNTENNPVAVYLASDVEEKLKNSACPHLTHGEEGTSYCALAESGNRALAAQVEELKKLWEGAELAYKGCSAHRDSLEQKLDAAEQNVSLLVSTVDRLNNSDVGILSKQLEFAEQRAQELETRRSETVAMCTQLQLEVKELRGIVTDLQLGNMRLSAALDERDGEIKAFKGEEPLP